MAGKWWGNISESAVPELAAAILDPERRHPIIVTTTPGYAETDSIAKATLDEADELRRAVGDVADVAIVATGRVSFALESLLPDHWHIFNGFCRSYPVGILADPNVRRSPLRRRRVDEVASEQVISDALGHAHASGALEEKAKGSTVVTGTVKGFVLNGEQALIDVGAVMPAVIWRDMTSPGIPLEWLLSAGADLTGELDHGHNRFVPLRPVFTANEFEVAFPHLGVTLALVEKVAPHSARLRVHPELAIAVDRGEVTSNPLDVLDLFLVEGEVVRVRVVHLSTGQPHLRLSDIDEDEPVLPAIAVVAGGTPWLIEGRNLPSTIGETIIDDFLYDVRESPLVDDALVGPGPEPEPEPEPAIAPLPRPMPGLQHATSPESPTPTLGGSPVVVSEPKGVVRDMSMKITALSSEIERLRREAAIASSSRHELDLIQRTLRDTRVDLGIARDSVNNFKVLHKQAVEELRKSRKSQPAPAAELGPRSRREAWSNDESWLRHEIVLAWVDRVQAAEKPRFPVPANYVIGQSFTESLGALDDGQFDKVMKAVVDVLTDRAKDIPGRDLHRLRTGSGGDDSFRVRPEDGAQAWRAAIEINSASARRLHYWNLNGRIELSRVVLHDDMDA